MIFVYRRKEGFIIFFSFSMNAVVCQVICPIDCVKQPSIQRLVQKITFVVFHFFLFRPILESCVRRASSGIFLILDTRSYHSCWNKSPPELRLSIKHRGIASIGR